MRKLLTGLLLVTLLAAGCGGDDEGGGEGTSTQAAVKCSGGEGHLQVADVLDKAPPGHQIVEADRENLRPLLDPLRKSLGGRLRGFETRTVVPKGRTVGTAVVVINSNEPIGDPKDVLEGARESAADSGGEYEEMTVADARAAFVRYDDTFQLTVPLGGCAVGMLIDQDRERILAVARALHAPAAG